MPELSATRAAGLSRLRDFVPLMGQRYADERNVDRGPGRHSSVSVLSPWIRRRLLTEAEVVDAAIAAHGPTAAAKFVEEVLWRGYFKGWMEHRPQVWERYRDGLLADIALRDGDPGLRSAVGRAEAGETGLDCFDAWAQELVATGYLHNHARMWFASIWIFTLRLPWRLGADFFLRHLLDGDPAVNTLGWRWVGGLHTRGKAYRARAGNIATFTAQRFLPREEDLDAGAAGLEATEPEGWPPLSALRAVTPPRSGAPSALLITEEDCCLEDFPLRALDLRAAATLAASPLRSPLAVSASVRRFEAQALADAGERAGVEVGHLQADRPETLAQWASAVGATQIVTPYVTRGPLQDWLAAAAPSLAANGIVVAEWRRDWDGAVWPQATAGYAKVKQHIPTILAGTARTGGSG